MMRISRLWLQLLSAISRSVAVRVECRVQDVCEREFGVDGRSGIVGSGGE